MENNSSTLKSGRKRSYPSSCQVCGADALYSYFGAVTCQSCKMFFKRNASLTNKEFRCLFDGNCSIVESTRHRCSSCRLKKCFQCGMKKEFIRSSREKHFTSNLNKKSEKKLLSVDQWKSIWNLIDCADFRRLFELIKNYSIEQESLPIKYRFKSRSTNQFLMKIFFDVQQIYFKNHFFRRLNIENQLFIYQMSIEPLTMLHFFFNFHQIRSKSFEFVEKSLSNLYDSKTNRLINEILQQIDEDFVFNSILRGIFLFSFGNFSSLKSFQNEFRRSLIQMEEFHLDLAWKYLSTKFNEEQIIRSFIKSIRLHFLLQQFLEQTKSNDQHQFIIQQIQHSLQNIFLSSSSSSSTLTQDNK